MRERDYPIYDTSFPGRRTAANYDNAPAPIYSAADLDKSLAEIDQAQAADVRQAIQDGADIHMDVQLYRKRGSKFLGIGFAPASASPVRVFEYPTIPASRQS